MASLFKPTPPEQRQIGLCSVCPPPLQVPISPRWKPAYPRRQKPTLLQEFNEGGSSLFRVTQHFLSCRDFLPASYLFTAFIWTGGAEWLQSCPGTFSATEKLHLHNIAIILAVNTDGWLSVQATSSSRSLKMT